VSHTPQTLWSVAVTTTPQLGEVFSQAFDDALAQTVFAPPRRGKAQINAIYDAEPDAKAITGRLAVIAFLNKTKPPRFQIKEMPKLDWLKKVAADFPPLPIARWTVHGGLHRKAVPDRRNALQIDATSAFGTGEHPTTRGCLMMLDRLLKKNGAGCRALDIGCGSGILAMAFAQARRKKALGIDLDPESVLVAQHNVRANGLQKFVRIALGNGYRNRIVRKNGPYDLILANIFAGPLSHMAKDLKRHLKPGGKAILSGILSHQANKVLAAHRMQKIYLVKKLKIGEWSVLLLSHIK
jgi:ribosomal protein L11 methyltransferase